MGRIATLSQRSSGPPCCAAGFEDSGMPDRILSLKSLYAGQLLQLTSVLSDRISNSDVAMKTRQVIFPLLLACVTAATLWRAANPREKVVVSLESLNLMPAPEFQLLDQNSRPTQLKGYVGRYRALIYFFPSGQVLDSDPVLQRLREVFPALKRSGVMVFAISTPLNPEQKTKAISYPFPILRDTVAGQPGSCSSRWGRTPTVSGNTPSAKIQPAVFLVEGTGLVSWENDYPKPTESPLDLINALVSGQR